MVVAVDGERTLAGRRLVVGAYVVVEVVKEETEIIKVEVHERRCGTL